MKQIFRRFLMVLWVICVLLAVFGLVSWPFENDASVWLLIASWFGIPALLLQFIFLGIINPLRLFQPDN